MAMRTPGFIATPFALNGDKTPIPAPLQPSGAVSFSQGWGPDYEKELGVDPGAKPVDRAVENQLMYIITQLIQRWQTEGAPEWIDPVDNGGTPVSYPTGAVILAFDTGGKRQIWINTQSTDNASAPPTTPGQTSGNGWSLLASTIGANFLVLNTASAQTVTGAVNFLSVIQAATKSITAAPDLSVANTNYVTRGRSLSMPTNITYGQSGMVILPTAMGAPSVGRYCRQFGISQSPTPTPGANPELSWTITFPTSFLYPPLVMFTPHATDVYTDMATAQISSLSRFSCTVRLINTTGQPLVRPVGVNWAAEGVVAALV